MGEVATVVPFETRLPCPVCLGIPMAKVALGKPGRVLVLDHCERCGGVWFEKGEPRRLTSHSPAELWKHIPPREHVMRPPCHGCAAPLDRDEAACVACGTLNELKCPACDIKTERHLHRHLTLDVCQQCKGVWFDHAELRSVWSLEVNDLARRDPSKFRDATVVGGDILLESLFWYPGLVIDAGAGAGHAFGAIADASIGDGIEVVGHAAEGVFEAISSILGSLFDGI